MKFHRFIFIGTTVHVQLWKGFVLEGVD